MVYFFVGLENCLGTDYGLSSIKGFRETAYYFPWMNGSSGLSFNYGDAGTDAVQHACLFYFAEKFNIPKLAGYQRKLERWYDYWKDCYLALMWYNPENVEEYSDNNTSLDCYFKSDSHQEVATFRSSYDTSKNPIFVGIKSGKNNTSHCDLDIGTFVLDALGNRWAWDLGKGYYNSPDYWDMSNNDSGRWQYYRKRTEGQNTLLINNSSSAKGGQDIEASCDILECMTTPGGGYAIIDMTDAYNTDYSASSVKRGLMLFNNRSQVMLQDEITCINSDAGIYWFMHTKADIDIDSANPTIAYLYMNKGTENEKVMMVQLICSATSTSTSSSNMVFSVLPAETRCSTLEGINNKYTSDDPESEYYQYRNSQYCKLSVNVRCIKAGTETSITVIFTPIVHDEDYDKLYTKDDIKKLSNWYSGSYFYKDNVGTLPLNESGEYEISTANQLMYFAAQVNSGKNYNGKTIKLKNDIDLNGKIFFPIGGYSEDDNIKNPFKGTFDGQGHQIKNMTIRTTYRYGAGLFGFISGAVIKNLGVTGSIETSMRKAGGICGLAANSTISCCYSKVKIYAKCGASIPSTAIQFGGIAGQCGGTCKIENSYNRGTIHAYNDCGGIVGYVSSNSVLTVQNCYNEGAGIYTDDSSKNDMTRGGLVGVINSSSSVINNNSYTCYTSANLKYSIGSTCNTSNIISASVLKNYASTLGSEYVDDTYLRNGGFPMLLWETL